MVEFTVPEVDYTRYTNRQLAAVPLAVLAVALLVIGGWYVATGAPVNPGVDFTGGTELRIATDAPQSEVAAAFDSQPESIRSVAADGTYVVTFQSGSATSTELQTQAEDAGFEVRSIDAVSANFGGETQLLALGGLAVAFAGMSVLVFAMFRSFVPSIAVVLSAFSDIVIPVALMNLFGIELSLGTVAALLMLIGYSVDSDILLNNHVLRRSGDFYESTARAMRTGVTMTLTSIAAMIVMTITATLFGIQLLAAIGTVLVFGLTADLMNTYMLNVTLLRWYKFEGVAR
ncbi:MULTISPECIES: protein translocase subunit SecF [Haloferax]|uniref:Protein-export membrane protein SecF n=4 Tax=Haloferax TaxID=2251 RepID=A0A6C0UYU4_HALVO|nr:MULTISPECIES: protein translocase subunit SecF [Haloferax]ELK54832.1 preprotein translocase subunit SecF [Haloferax sp. BAB-2207]ELZ56521.1 preprotein translocase subunit SecF [Haloferax sp. ATCC BAA-646]ELZ68151.1 preprotein translocase subunit SecF [Haloferax sp. ATCC BAA-645]ELZ75044.1 preprotein translocase subunit SecF [Haloferax lucentense DSM 14919]ELZ87809.1 preprotein translocase subunit SecF [Haloferax alexandrinus JCM 10717]